MSSTPFQIVGFAVFVLGSFVSLGGYLLGLSGGGGFQTESTEVSAEAGEAIFHGKGKCSTCHSVGTEGSTVRCPNLGVKPGKFTQPVAVRAATLRPGLSAIEYLVESLYEPAAFTVPGFPTGLMTPVDQPPISLTDDEIRSVLLFLWLKSGLDPDTAVKDIASAQRRFAGRVRVAAGSEKTQALKLPEGDPEQGKEAFVELRCYQCHKIQGTPLELPAAYPAGVGPDLAGIGGVQTEQYLFESIINPNAVILADPSPELRYAEGGTSKMPDFGAVMTASQVIDLVAFLKTLKEVPAAARSASP